MKTGVILADRYRLDEPIAAGGVGQVWRATDQVLQRQVAVKLLRPEYADHPETLSRFRAEARHAGSLAHPAIAQVYDYGDNPHEGPPYLVMELVEGPSLAEVLATEPVTPAYALDVLAKAATGLAAAHEAGLVHRDIKPGNILLSQDGQVKITDFGIAHAVGSAPVTDPGLVMGTTQYLAPERIAGGSGTPAADLYSLGIVMHECLTGVPPYEGTPAEVMAGQLYSPLPPLPEGTPVEVQDLIARLTAKDPEQRISDAGELAALAETVRAAITPGEPMARPAQPAPPVSPVDGVAVPHGAASPGAPGPRVFGTWESDGGAWEQDSRDWESDSPGWESDGRDWESDGGAWEQDSEPAPWEPADSGVPGNALALRETSIDRGALALRAVGDTESPRTVYGTLVDTGPMAAEEVTSGSLARHPLTGLRHTGELLVTERPRRRRRAAIGVGVLVLAGGAGLTGAVASGALHPSPVANRTHTHPSLSVVQPNTTSAPRAGAGASPAKHAKPYKPKHAKSSPSPSKSAAATASPAPSAPTSSTGAGAPNPQPSPSQSTPVCILGILCN